MGAVPLTPANVPQGDFVMHDESRPSPDWVRLSAVGALAAGAILLLTGKRRAGLVASVAGTALAMVQERELVKQAWDALPGYLDTTQRMLDQAQQTIDDLASKRDKIKSILGKENKGDR